MIESAAKRALRTMDLIPYVLENPGIAISALARKLLVSEEQIKKDLELIFMCGLPGYTPYELIDIVFEDGSVTVIDPQVLNKPRRFSKTELVVITLGLKIMSELSSSDPIVVGKVETLLQKVAPKEAIESIGIVSNNPAPKFLEVIREAIIQKHVISFDYSSVTKDELTSRRVQPRNVYLSNGNVYLSAYDIDKKAERVFRIDLMLNCKLAEKISKEIESSTEEDLFVQLKVSQSNRIFIERNSSIISDMDIKNDYSLVNIIVSNFEWLSRTILSNAPDLEIISPAQLKADIAERASEILALYTSLPS